MSWAPSKIKNTIFSWRSVRTRRQEEHTQSNQATLLSSRNISSQPISESGIDRICETRMQKWMRCNVPPMMQADVLGAGRGTLLGKMEISKAIRDGKEVILTHILDTPSRVENC